MIGTRPLGQAKCAIRLGLAGRRASRALRATHEGARDAPRTPKSCNGVRHVPIDGRRGESPCPSQCRRR